MRGDVRENYEDSRDVIHDRYLRSSGAVDVEQGLRDAADLLRGGAVGAGDVARQQAVAAAISVVAEALLLLLEQGAEGRERASR